RRIDPPFHDALDVAEIADHIASVELAGAHFDFRHGVVSVRVLANAVVIEQPVPVTEVDPFGDRIHPVILCQRLFSSPADWIAPCCWPRRRLAMSSNRFM